MLEYIKIMHEYGHRDDVRSVLNAAISGHYEVVKYLVKEGYEIPLCTKNISGTRCSKYIESLIH